MVADIPLPRAVINVLEIFRSSGRFIWVTNYCLVVLGIVWVMRLLPAPAALGILAVGLVVQAIDLAPAFRVYHDMFAGTKSTRFTDPAFADLGQAHDKLIMVPPWQCGREAEAEYPVKTFEPLLLLVMDNRLETNNFHSGRLPRDQERYHCGEFPAAFPTTASDPKTAYLFTVPSFGSLGATVLQTHSCDLAEDLILCRGDRGKAGFTARAQQYSMMRQPKRTGSCNQLDQLVGRRCRTASNLAEMFCD